MQSPAALAILGPACRGRRGALAGSAGFGVLAVVVDLARPWPLAYAVDHVIVPAGAGDGSLLGLSPTLGLILVGVTLLALTGALGLLDMATVVWAERAAERIGADLRRDVFDHAMSLSPRWHDRVRSGELVSRLTTDVGRLLDALVAITVTVLPDVLRIGLVLVVLVSLDAQLAAVALAVVPVLAVFAIRQRRRVRSVQHEARTRAGRMAAATTDLVRNVRAVQAFGRMRHAGERFGAHNRAVRDIDVRAVAVESRWTPVADIVLAVGSALVLVVGGRAVIAGRLSVGELLVVTSYLSALYSPVRSLSRLSGTLAKSAASAERISEVLDCDERIVDRPDALRVPAMIDEIRFTDVHFAYRPDRPVLQGFDLTVRAGETVALVGPSGCGKSTIMSLLLRLYDVDSGSIQLDGIDVRDLRHAELRRRIAFVPQDAWLLDATIAENIGFAAPSASRHEVLRAGRTALVDEIADGKPHGYDSPVGENGGQLSGGQRRRIALARAVASDAPVVLLDEPTASLDPAAAGVLVEAIRRATVGRTVLLVTHDPELAATADRVVTLRAEGADGVALDRPSRVITRVERREEVPS